MGHFLLPHFAKFSSLSLVSFNWVSNKKTRENGRFIQPKYCLPMWTIALKIEVYWVWRVCFSLLNALKIFRSEFEKLSINQLVVLIASQLICISEQKPQLINEKIKRNRFVMKPNMEMNGRFLATARSFPRLAIVW